jgi:hypothetical protein
LAVAVEGDAVVEMAGLTMPVVTVEASLVILKGMV